MATERDRDRVLKDPTLTLLHTRELRRRLYSAHPVRSGETVVETVDLYLWRGAAKGVPAFFKVSYLDGDICERIPYHTEAEAMADWLHPVGRQAHDEPAIFALVSRPARALRRKRAA